MQELDIMGRANEFTQFLAQMHEDKHLNYKRISFNGSAPTRTVWDAHTKSKKEMIYLASNDYLNLSNHPKVINAGIDAIKKYGAGAGSVPLLGGSTDLHKKLEDKIAGFKGCESAVIYTSGYGSNASSIMSMLDEKDIAIVDMLAHASLIDGCKNTNIKYFKHNDPKSLDNVLSLVKDKYRTKLVIIDGVYSMDGDIAKLDVLLDITHQHGAYLMVDEAHATGVIGDKGRGTPEYYNLSGKVDIVSGTFSKAIGCVGGFVASNKELINLLNYYSRGNMFSTAMTPQSVGSIIAALDVIENEPERRNKLWRNIVYFRNSLQELGFNIGNSQTAIFPIIIGDDFITSEMCRELHEMNIYVNPVLYPAVSKRLARIRMSLMAEHTKEQLNFVLDALESLGKKYNILKEQDLNNNIISIPSY